MNEIQQIAIDYKRKISSNFISITQDDISSRISGTDVFVSTKIDGEFNLLYFDGDKSVLINGSGIIKKDLPFLKESEKLLKDKKIKSLIVAGELHINKVGHRSRISEVMSAISKNKGLLTFSPFDILKVNGEENIEHNYEQIINILSDVFENNKNINPVDFKKISSEEVSAYYDEVVIGKGSEGLVIRFPDFPLIYKLKPLYTLDVAIIGYTEHSEKKIRDLLYALKTSDGKYVQIGKTGNGLNTQLRGQIYKDIKKNVVPSSYIETDGRGVAFQMVKPLLVAEIAVNELLTENSKGLIKNQVIEYNEKTGFAFSKSIYGTSLINPVFKRLRKDKKVVCEDIGLSQVYDKIFIDNKATDEKEDLKKSEIFIRDVYTKTVKENTNIQKFLAWKTNKENNNIGYPAYVLHYTNYSPTRKDPLKREVRISNSKKQIVELLNQFIEKNIKKGWSKVE